MYLLRGLLLREEKDEEVKQDRISVNEIQT